MSASESSLGAVRCSRRPPFRHLGFTALRSCMNDKYFHPVCSPQQGLPTNSIHIHNHFAQQLSNSVFKICQPWPRAPPLARRLAARVLLRCATSAPVTDRRSPFPCRRYPPQRSAPAGAPLHAGAAPLRLPRPAQCPAVAALSAAAASQSHPEQTGVRVQMQEPGHVRRQSTARWRLPLRLRALPLFPTR